MGDGGSAGGTASHLHSIIPPAILACPVISWPPGGGSNVDVTSRRRDAVDAGWGELPCASPSEGDPMSS